MADFLRHRRLIVVAPLVVLAWFCWEWRCCVAYNPSPAAKWLLSAVGILDASNRINDAANSASSFKGLPFACHLARIGKNQESIKLLELLLKTERMRSDRSFDRKTVSRIFLAYRDIDSGNQLCPRDWIELCQPIRAEAYKVYDSYKDSVPVNVSITEPPIAQIFEILSERYQAHNCLDEAIECHKAALIAQKTTQRNNSAHYHQLLYELASLYHRNGMDKDASAVIMQTVSLPEALNDFGCPDESFREEHVARCNKLLSALKI